tara:strand:+ start:511 stop:1308 length:798 start_codon:yes stop_codon:yes gene_type:complete
MKIAIAGASGRMGKMLIESIASSKDMYLSGALEKSNAQSIGSDPLLFLGKFSEIKITSNLNEALSSSQFLIDFTKPEASIKNLQYCSLKGVKVVLGTTGFNNDQLDQIKLFSQKIPIVMSPNMSIGVNATMKLIEIATKLLPKDYDIEIIEAHHKNKIDAPSGTAIKMGEIISKVLSLDLKKHSIFDRSNKRREREKNIIGFSSIRGGDIIGDHTVLFAGSGERIEITHKSSSRKNYSNGSLQAVRFLKDKKIGLYNMQNVLGYE